MDQNWIVRALANEVSKPESWLFFYKKESVSIVQSSNPYPGTELYKQFLQDGRLTKPQWWLDPNYTYGSVVFTPKNISEHELEQGRLRLYREFYSPSSILKRLWEPRANLQDLWHAFTFLTMNLPANNEKQMRFGKALGAC